MRGLKNMESARLLAEAWLVHYNFFKEHGTLGDVSPAVKMGATPIKDWNEVVSQTKTITPLRPKAVVPVGLKPARKPRHPKRRPKTLKQKTYAQVVVASPRAVYADKSEERLSRKPHRGWKRIY